MSALAGIDLLVSHHAMWQAAERFPRFDTLRIEPEIRTAFAAGRVSRSKPSGLAPPDYPDCLYAWTADGRRVYVLCVDRKDTSRFAVRTTMRAR